MLVTLNSDASYIHQTKEAGYAFWISSDVGRFKKYGKLKNAVNSTTSEVMSIINGLHFCRTHPQLKHCTKIVINTDCMYAIHLGTCNKKLSSKSARQLRGRLQEYLGKFRGHKCEIEFRHVKAHVEITDSRSYVNDWLDQMAKKAAKEK